jgi:AcrR family transcriptional regulator
MGKEPKSATTKKRERKTAAARREDWLQAALRVLEHQGVANVKINALAEELGITRGSFYGQFKSRQDLLDSLNAYWRDVMDQYLELARSRTSSSLNESLAQIFRVIEENRIMRFEPAMRIWAKNDPSVAQTMTEIDAKRSGFIVTLFAKAGFPPNEAQARAQAFYAYSLHFSLLNPGSVPRAAQAELLSMLDWFSRPLALPA